MKRVILAALIPLALVAGVGLRAIREGAWQDLAHPRDLEGLWKVAQVLERERGAEGWREVASRDPLFYEFRGGAFCTEARHTPEFRCTRYEPFTRDGETLALAAAPRVDPPQRFRARFLSSQLELTTEERHGGEWVAVRRAILVRVPAAP